MAYDIDQWFASQAKRHARAIAIEVFCSIMLKYPGLRSVYQICAHADDAENEASLNILRAVVGNYGSRLERFMLETMSILVDHGYVVRRPAHSSSPSLAFGHYWAGGPDIDVLLVALALQADHDDC